MAHSRNQSCHLHVAVESGDNETICTMYYKPYLLQCNVKHTEEYDSISLIENIILEWQYTY